MERAPRTGGGGLSPAHWGEAERRHFAELNRTWGQPKPLARGRKGMVVGTSGAFAIRAGVEALRQGGSAMDAALTTALTQIALHAGCVTSYAGVLCLVAYDAETGKLLALDACYDIPRAETDPLTIPDAPTPSGRTALVPGFMAGVDTAHRRFGKLPFASLFEPAISLAEEGFEVDLVLGVWIQRRQKVLSRRPATRAVFTKENGDLYQIGDRFCQPELARTLRAVAEQGTGYFYAGPWAQAFVQAVQEEKGKVTLKDLNHYTPTWSKPLRTTYREYELCAPPPGGVPTLEAMNLLELADLRHYGHYTHSPRTLYELIQIARVAPIVANAPADRLRACLPSLSLTDASRVTKKHARVLWAKLRDPAWNREFQGLLASGGSHSEGVVAVDARGNVVALCHSINTDTWGSTGIFVGGVSIPDSACFQQERVKRAGPGRRLPNQMNPLVALKGGKPVLGCSAIGSGLLEATLQCLHNVLDFGMDPKAAAEAPLFHGPRWGTRMQAVHGSDFSTTLLAGVRKRGQPIAVLSEKEQSEGQGWWIGLAIDPAGDERRGGACREFNGYALPDEGELENRQGPDGLRAEIARLEGEWSLVSGERDGEALPEQFVRIGRQRTTGNETTVLFGDQVFIKAAFSLDPSHKPKTIDYVLTAGPSQEEVQRGIYKQDGDTVTFCFAAPGKPRPTDFTTRPSAGRTLSVWRRAPSP